MRTKVKILRREFSAALAAIALAAGVSPSFAVDEIPEKEIKAYVASLAKAETEIEAGKYAEAKTTLEKTDATQRSFEYDYLLAQANVAKQGSAPPDLVKKISASEVETRYGVLSPTARQAVFICRDGNLRIYDLSKPTEPPQIANHEKSGAIWTGAFSHDGKTFAAGHEAGEVVIWDTATWKEQQVMKIAEAAPVREIALAPDGSSVVAEGNSSLELWTLKGEVPKKIADLGERYNFGEGLAYSPQGDLIATGGMFDIILHDAKTGAQKSSMRHASYTMGLEFSPDGKQIASAPRGNVNKFLSVFDIASAKANFIGGPFPHYVAGLAFTPDGKRVVATGPIQDVRLFDPQSGTEILKLNRGVMTSKPSISHDGRILAWCEQNSFCYIDLGTKKSSE
jgi:WD40 repeat protein